MSLQYKYEVMMDITLRDAVLSNDTSTGSGYVLFVIHTITVMRMLELTSRKRANVSCLNTSETGLLRKKKAMPGRMRYRRHVRLVRKTKRLPDT